MVTVEAVLISIALALFIVDAIGVSPRNIQSAGLAFIAAAMLVPMV